MSGRHRNHSDTLLRLSTVDTEEQYSQRRIVVRACQRILRWLLLIILLILALYALALVFHLHQYGPIAATLVSLLTLLAHPPLLPWQGLAGWVCHQWLMLRSCFYMAPLVAIAGYVVCGWIIIYLLEFSVPRIIEHHSSN